MVLAKYINGAMFLLKVRLNAVLIKIGVDGGILTRIHIDLNG